MEITNVAVVSALLATPRGRGRVNRPAAAPLCPNICHTILQIGHITAARSVHSAHELSKYRFRPNQKTTTELYPARTPAAVIIPTESIRERVKGLVGVIY